MPSVSSEARVAVHKGLAVLAPRWVHAQFRVKVYYRHVLVTLRLYHQTDRHLELLHVVICRGQCSVRQLYNVALLYFVIFFRLDLFVVHQLRHLLLLVGVLLLLVVLLLCRIILRLHYLLLRSVGLRHLLRVQRILLLSLRFKHLDLVLRLLRGHIVRYLIGLWLCLWCLRRIRWIPSSLRHASKDEADFLRVYSDM